MPITHINAQYLPQDQVSQGILVYQVNAGGESHPPKFEATTPGIAGAGEAAPTLITDGLDCSESTAFLAQVLTVGGATSCYVTFWGMAYNDRWSIINRGDQITAPKGAAFNINFALYNPSWLESIDVTHLKRAFLQVTAVLGGGSITKYQACG